MSVYFVQGALSEKIKIGKTEKCPVKYVRMVIQARSGEPVRLLGLLLLDLKEE